MVYLGTKKVFLFLTIKSKTGISSWDKLVALTNWIYATFNQSERIRLTTGQQWAGLSLFIEVDLHCAENASIIYRNYMLAICLIGFFGPLIIIIFCYARILGIMYSSEKKMRKGFRTFGDRNVAEVACSGWTACSWGPFKNWIIEIREKNEPDPYSKAR